MKEEGYFKRKVLPVVLDQLRRGTTPEKIALTVAVGLALALFPVIGLTTGLCLAAGMLLELNHPILQLVNHLLFPVQIALLLPFYRAGERLFGVTPVPFSLPKMRAMFSADLPGALRAYGMTGLRGVAVWCLSAPVASLLVYRSLTPLLRRLSQKR